MADWRNVGNWHWKEKNCFEWAKKYFEENLVGIAATSGDANAKVTSVDSVTGDVDLNIRKGRLLAIYDVEIKVSWSASKGDDVADTLTGSITIPEVAHDTDDYVYEISAANSSIDKLPLKDFVRKSLTLEITKKLEGFTEDLKKVNGTEMYIPDNGEAGSASETDAKLASDFKQGKSGSVTTSADTGAAKSGNATFSTVSISHTVELMCSTQDLFATLTDPQRVSIWTRAPAEIQPKENTTFKLFGGHIEGKMIKLEPGECIEQTWRVASWPAGHYSKVKIDLEQLSSSTKLQLKQTGVPFNEEEATKANWDRYYWNSIKGCFG